MLRNTITSLARRHYFYSRHGNNAWTISIRKKTLDVDGDNQYSFPLTETAFQSSSRFGNFRITNIDDDNIKLTIQHPGLAYDDYDYKGFPKFWRIMKLLESVLLYSHQTPLDDTMRSFQDYTKLGQECMLMIVSTEISTTKAMYDSRIPKFPLIFTIEGEYVGKSSHSSIYKIYSEKDHIELCRNVMHFVSVDKMTRQPKPLPDWWRDKYSQAGDKYSQAGLQQRPLKFDRLNTPSDHCVYHSVVRWSDTDLNRHLNTCSIGNIIEDSLQFCASRKLIPFDINYFKNGLSRLCLSVYGESKVGDDLYVNMWMHQDCDRMVYFNIKNNGLTVTQCSLLYH